MNTKRANFNLQDRDELFDGSHDVRRQVPANLEEQLTTLQIDNERLMRVVDVSFIHDRKILTPFCKTKFSKYVDNFQNHQVG